MLQLGLLTQASLPASTDGFKGIRCYYPSDRGQNHLVNFANLYPINMAFEEPITFPDQDFIDSAVYDQRDRYIGTVVEVSRHPSGGIVLLVQQASSEASSYTLRMAGEAIQHFGVNRKAIHADLATYPVELVKVQALPLWQEHLKINRSRQKISEISIRRVTDVYTIEVPVRSEKLVIENVQTGDVLTEIGLLNPQIAQTDAPTFASALTYTENQIVRGNLTMLKDAVSFLKAISRFPDNGFKRLKVDLSLFRGKETEQVSLTFESTDTALHVLARIANLLIDQCGEVHLELAISNPERAATYQNWLSRYPKRDLRPKAKSPKLPEISPPERSSLQRP